MSAAQRAVLALVGAFVVVGCAVGPDYKLATPPAPSAGKFVSNTPDVASNDEPPAQWWHLYNTPALDGLVQAALTHNNTLLAAAANLAQARGALALARAGQFPSTNLTAGMQYGVTADAAFANTILDKGPASPAPLYMAGLDVSYEVDLFGRVRRAIESASANVEAQKAAEDVVRVSVAGETIRAYVDACAYAQELTVAKQSLDIVAQSADITTREARDGTASDFDVARAQELVAETNATLPVYEGERRTALFELAVLTGQPPEEISHDADICKAPPKLGTVLPTGDVKGLFRRRPDVREAERQLAANVAQIGVATADLYPTITIGGTFETAANSISGLSALKDLTYGVGPLLNWSFPNILVAEAEIREAGGVASASYANFRSTVLQALQDTEDALTAYRSELTRNASLTTAANQSQAALNSAQTQYRLGRVSYLDLLTAQTDLVNIRSELAASDQSLASDQVTVFKALGGGWEQAPKVEPLPIEDAKSGTAIPVH